MNDEYRRVCKAVYYMHKDLYRSVGWVFGYSGFGNALEVFNHNTEIHYAGCWSNETILQNAKPEYRELVEACLLEVSIKQL